MGLGKTIELGVLLTELIQRGRGQRILVVALKSILAQFQEELWARFTIPLVRLDSVGIQRVQARIPANQNPFHVFDRVIVSVDTLKKDSRYRAYLEGCHWDAVVIDECQNVAVRGKNMAQRARLAKLLARNTDALILTSATPHDGKPESFASLMQLLEPTAVADPKNYTHEEVGDLFIRRFQKDVRAGALGQFHERQVDTLTPRCSEAEETALRAIRAADFRTIGRSHKTDALFRVLLLKALLSSPAACISTLEARQKKLQLRAHDPKEKRPDDVQWDLTLIGQLLTTLQAIALKDQAKLQALFTYLESLGYGPGRAGQRVVIFSERITTLRLLQDQLAKRFGLKTTADRKGELGKWKKGEIGVFHGSLPDQEQYALVQDFANEKGKLRVLLGSDAAAEGLNLHHTCHHMVHFDVPWSLITLEQRNGRIDRFGQTQPPIIRYLLADPADPELKGDLRILERLIEKETHAAQNLGDVAWLMKLHDAVEEERRIAQAIERGERPEDVLPDVDPGDDEDDWLQQLLSQAPETDTAAQTTTPFRLYTDDLDYARQAFTELELDGQGAKVRWEEQLSGFVLQMPPDLALRYKFLPPELQRGRDGVLKLSTDRQRVMDAYARARSTQDGWPEWELFWEQHPVGEWLNDRVLASFQRHEAPLVLTQQLPPGHAAYLFQGTLSNQRSQPVQVVWAAAVRDARGSFTLEPLQDLVARVGLQAPLPNSGQQLDPAPLQAALPQATRFFNDHMRQVSLDYQKQIVADLRPAVRKLRGWKADALDRLAGIQQTLLVQRSDQQRRIEQQRQEIEAVYQARQDWIKNSCLPSPPNIRLALVLAGVPHGA